MSATLTERYIAAAVHTIPLASRDDVQAELEVSIADAIETRAAQGESHDTAERAVLTDLGDPEVLSAGYADRPLHLIGPRFYLTWWRLLKLLWAIVPVAAMGGAALGQALNDAPIADIIGDAASIGFAAAIHVAFWVTLVFAVLERTRSTPLLAPWTIDRLPEVAPKGAGRADMVVSLFFLAAGVTAVIWDQTLGFVFHDGNQLPFLNPGLWPWWITGLLMLMAAKAALTIAVYLSRQWNAGFAVINTALALAFAIPTTMLLSAAQLVNPDFVSFALIGNGLSVDTLHILGVILGAAIVGFSSWDVIDGWIKTLRVGRR